MIKLNLNQLKHEKTPSKKKKCSLTRNDTIMKVYHEKINVPK
jgi:hypothetical protein